MKKGLDLNRVVLLGRTFEEYLRFFGLDANQLRGRRILDVAGGVSSFTAEANQLEITPIAFDPVYSMGLDEIRQCCERDLEEVTRDIVNKSVYCWDFYKSPAGMRKFREHAYKAFLEDIMKNPDRYIAGKLPRSDFEERQFDLTLVSYFLFVYEEHLSYEFHRDSIRELMRITRGEIRIYPIVTFEAEESKHLKRLRHEAEFAAWEFDEVKTDFEFLRNSNRFLKIFRRKS